MDRFRSGAAGAIAAAMSINVAGAALEPLSLARVLEFEVSITASHARSFAHGGGWFDAERSLVDHTRTPVGRAPGGFVQAFGSPEGDLFHFGWTSPVRGKSARGEGTLVLRLITAARIEEVRSDSALVTFTSGGRTLAEGFRFDPGLHRIAWSLIGPAPSEAFGGGLRLVAASSPLPPPAALPAAVAMLAGSLRPRRRRP